MPTSRASIARRLGALTALGLLAFPASAFAQDAGLSSGSSIPNTGFFAGLGGSYNWARVDQDLKGIGISEVFIGSTLVASGNAGGPAADFDSDGSAFAPALSASYKTKYAAGFTNSNGALTSVGTAYINASQQFTSQSFGVSLNKVF